MVLTPSTPVAYPLVVSRTFASFRIARFSVPAGQGDFGSGFDSRQLHRNGPGQGRKTRPGPLCVNTRAN